MSFIVNAFCCRRNPRVLELIQEFPTIDGAAVAGWRVRQNLSRDEMQELKKRMALEADLRDEFGEGVYRSLLQRVNNRSLVVFTDCGPAYDYFLWRESRGNPPQLRDSSLKQKALWLGRAGNRSAFLHEAAERFPGVDPAIFTRAFPRFSEGIERPTDDDWVDMGIVAGQGGNANMVGWRLVDFLARERRGVGELEREVERRQGELRRGIVDPRGVRRDRMFLAHLEEASRAFETGEKRRGYDLVTGVKKVAEVARMFHDWERSIQTVIKQSGRELGISRDFQWFREELSGIRDEMRRFNVGFEPRLLNILPMTSDAIRAQYPDRELERLIVEGLNRMDRGLYTQYPAIFCNLQLAQTGGAFTAAQHELLRRHAGNQRLCNAFNIAVPNAFQVPARVRLCLSELAQALSRPSPLRLRILNALTRAEQIVGETDEARERALQGRNENEREFLQRVYPTISPDKTTWMRLFGR
jgi:hypothetical protein